MSLIDEALKRARHEASRQEAVKRDAARHDGPRPIPKLYAERQASRAPLWAGISTGAAVALLGVVAWLLWGRAPSAPVSVAAAEPPRAVSAAPSPVPAPAPPTAAVPAPRGEAVPRLPAPAVPQGPAVPAPQVFRPAAPPATPVAPAPTVTPPQREQPAKPTESSVAAPKPTPAPRAASSSAAPSAAPQTYVREVALPGGGPHLRLGGIAYSEEAPIALINGAALGRGEVVEGYVVRRIDAAEVELEGPAGRVVLRLK